MSDQALDLRRSLLIVRRHKIIVGVAAALGLAAGIAFTMRHPPQASSEALVVLPSSATRFTATEVVIAGSDPVLSGAVHHVDPSVPLQLLQGRIQVKSLTPRIISIEAQGTTAEQAEDTANAVADSFIAYVGAGNSPGGQVVVRTLERATSASVASLPRRAIITGVLGAFLGGLIGAIIALAVGRSDRRLRERDEIADAIGVPVLASISTGHPSDAAGWTRLLDDYQPGVVHAWNMRKALQDLGLADARRGSSASLAVVSLSSDPGALALGPQLAVYAASLGIPTALVIGPQQDANATATLRSACAVPPPAQSRRPGRLQVSAWDHDGVGMLPDAALTIVAAVVDSQAPQVSMTMRTTIAVLGVSAGAATAEQLARVAVSAATDGRQVAGILVANPNPADRTTGRLPHLARPTRRRSPTRLTGS
jgi:capsular polysaccharide biosynthesis protein